jgi:fucose permease
MLPILTTLGTIIFCLLLVGITVWMTYKYIGGGLNSVASSVSTLQSAAGGLAPS